MKHNIALGLTALVTVIAIVFAVRQRGAFAALQTELAEARMQAAEAGRLKAENERLSALENETRRLRDENKDLPRLRGEVARLRRDLVAAAAQSAKPSVQAPEEPAPAPTVETNLLVFSGSARATLVPGQTLVMGGWPLAPGKRTLALFTPETSSGGADGAIHITGLYVQVPEAMLAGPGWEPFQAGGREASSSSVFEAEPAKKFVETLQQTAGVEILSSPRLATTSGVAGAISVGDSSGRGLNTALLPVWSADGRTIDLMVSNSIRRLPAAPAGER
jgi:hypothetical protein